MYTESGISVVFNLGLFWSLGGHQCKLLGYSSQRAVTGGRLIDKRQGLEIKKMLEGKNERN